MEKVFLTPLENRHNELKYPCLVTYILSKTKKSIKNVQLFQDFYFKTLFLCWKNLKSILCELFHKPHYPLHFPLEEQHCNYFQLRYLQF